MTISASSVLVELNISVWTANKLDRTATDNVLVSNKALTSDAAQVRKNLMAGTSDRKKIADYAAGCRLWHNTRTLPWSDKGPRLLPTGLFFDYKSEMNARQSMFNYMVDEFCANYHSLVGAASANMGDLFDANDYPSLEEVREKFGFRLVFSPVPESGDFRLDIPQEDIRDMREGYDRAFNDRLAEAMRTPWTKLYDMLSSMSGKLVEPEDEDKRRWHDTFLDNASELCELLAHLNITKDPELEKARFDLERAISGVDMDSIREDSDTRVDLKAKLDEILKGYEW